MPKKENIIALEKMREINRTVKMRTGLSSYMELIEKYEEIMNITKKKKDENV